MTERPITTEGQRPHRVRVYTTTTKAGATLVRVEWRESGRRVRESRPDSAENRTWARRYAKVVAARLVLGQQRTTRVQHPPMRAVVDAYLAAKALHWRAKTLTGSTNKLEVWLAYTGDAMPITAVTPELLDQFRLALRTTPRTKTQAPMAAHQVSRHANEVKALVRFARARKLLAENPLAEYEVKLGKDERQLDVAEYSNAEWAAVLRQLDPRQALQWRPYCLIVLGGLLGARQTALRSLAWADVNLEARTVTWAQAFDKMGRERTQPLPRAAVRIFRLARVWRGRDGYGGPWVFYGTQRRSQDRPYTYQALNAQLHHAERRAGVASKPYRAMHGLRRTAAGNVLAATANTKLAGQWIGDTDPKSLNRYFKQRDAELVRLASTTALPPNSASQQPPNGQRPKQGRRQRAVRGAK